MRSASEVRKAVREVFAREQEAFGRFGTRGVELMHHVEARIMAVLESPPPPPRAPDWRKVDPTPGLKVPVIRTEFGLLLNHGIDSRMIWMVLPRDSGWESHGHLCLAHQTYVKKVQCILAAKPDVREIAVVGADTGQWVTVWERV